MLTFSELKEKNLSRACKWHKTGLSDWSTSEWCVAVLGEAGEIANTTKKLNRIRIGMANKNSHDQVSTEKEAIDRIGEEIADTIVYADLLAQSLGLDLEQEIVKKFNKISDNYGFSEKLSN